MNATNAMIAYVVLFAILIIYIKKVWKGVKKVFSKVTKMWRSKS